MLMTNNTHNTFQFSPNVSNVRILRKYIYFAETPPQRMLGKPMQRNSTWLSAGGTDYSGWAVKTNIWSKWKTLKEAFKAQQVWQAPAFASAHSDRVLAAVRMGRVFFISVSRHDKMKMRPRNVSKDNDTDSELLLKHHLQLTGRLVSRAYIGWDNHKRYSERGLMLQRQLANVRHARLTTTFVLSSDQCSWLGLKLTERYVSG